MLWLFSEKDAEKSAAITYGHFQECQWQMAIRTKLYARLIVYGELAYPDVRH